MSPTQGGGLGKNQKPKKYVMNDGSEANLAASSARASALSGKADGEPSSSQPSILNDQSEHTESTPQPRVTYTGRGLGKNQKPKKYVMKEGTNASPVTGVHTCIMPGEAAGKPSASQGTPGGIMNDESEHTFAGDADESLMIRNRSLRFSLVRGEM